MAVWTPGELDRAGEAEEIRLASRRADGSLRPYVTMWVVRAGGVERDVSFAQAPPEVQGDIDAAYHTKYDRYGPRIVGSVTGPGSHAVTVCLVPQPGKEK